MSVQGLVDEVMSLPAYDDCTCPVAPPLALVALIIRWDRHLRQWKKSTLAAFAEVSISTVERAERGEKVSDLALDKIAQALGREAGCFTAPRLPMSPEQARAEAVETFSHLEPIAVARMATQKAVRAAAQCQVFLFHSPDVPERFHDELTNFRESIELASFVLSTPKERLDRIEAGRRDLYQTVLDCVRDLERKGLTVLVGSMALPQVELPGWKVAIVSITPRAADPGAPKRRHLLVDKRMFSRPLRNILADFANEDALGKKITPGACRSRGDTRVYGTKIAMGEENAIEKPDGYPDHQGLLAALSLERFGRYLDWAGGDEAVALGLYSLNTRLSEALYTPLQMLEVALRNRIHAVMSDAYGDRWFDKPQLLLANIQIEQLAYAYSDLNRDDKQASPGRMVAALTFSFWTAMMNAAYDDLWRRTLHRIARREDGRRPARKDFTTRLTPIRTLRNRIAHHEPILGWNLPKHHDNMLQLTGWLSPAAARWCARHDRFDEVYPQEPIVLVTPRT